MLVEAYNWLRDKRTANLTIPDIQNLAAQEKAANIQWGEALEAAIAAWLRTEQNRQRTINGPVTASESWFQPANRIFGKTPCYRIYSDRLTSGDIAWANSLDSETDAVMSECQNPQQPGLKKGVVFGYVQSGKTANFNGVIAKAIDSGYRLIFVFGGIKKPLLRQTIERLTFDLTDQVTNHDSNEIRNSLLLFDQIPSRNQIGAANGILSQTQRFLGNAKADSLKSVVICTLKNSTRIPRVKIIIEAFPSLPVLIIDDECDEAAVPRAQRNLTSQRMAELIDHLGQRRAAATYLGYTATPAANFLVRKSLRAASVFPDDFIHILEEPPEDNEYLGITNLFDEGESE